jgi:hypothetical protein
VIGETRDEISSGRFVGPDEKSQVKVENGGQKRTVLVCIKENPL